MNPQYCYNKEGLCEPDKCMCHQVEEKDSEENYHRVLVPNGADDFDVEFIPKE